MLSVLWFIWISLRFFCFVSVISSSGWPNLDACIGKQQIIFMNRLQMCVFFSDRYRSDIVWCWLLMHPSPDEKILLRSGILVGLELKRVFEQISGRESGICAANFPPLWSLSWRSGSGLKISIEILRSDWIFLDFWFFFLFSIFLKDFSTLSSSFRGDSRYFKSWFWKFYL